jgi:hypothetical protein
VFGVGKLNAGTGTMPRDNTGGVVLDNPNSLYGKTYSGSKTVMYYNGQKYTGYTAFPYTTKHAGQALAIRGTTTDLVEIFYVIGTDAPSAVSTYAIIERLAYDANYFADKVVYEVRGSTGAITQAYTPKVNGDWEQYTTGQVVDVRSSGDGYEIIEERTYALTSIASGYVTRVASDDSWIEVYGASSAIARYKTIPTVDAAAIGQNLERKDWKTYPELYDNVTVYTNSTTYLTEAIVINSYTTPDNVAAANTTAEAARSALLALNSGDYTASGTTLTIANANGKGTGYTGSTPTSGFAVYLGSNGFAYTSQTLDWSDAVASGYPPATTFNAASGAYGQQSVLLNVLWTALGTDAGKLAGATTIQVSNVTAGDSNTSGNVLDAAADGDEYIEFTLTIGTVFGYQTANPITVRLENLNIQA